MTTIDILPQHTPDLGIRPRWAHSTPEPDDLPPPEPDQTPEDVPQPDPPPVQEPDRPHAPMRAV